MGLITLAGMAHVMMNKVNIPREIRYKLFGKVSKTASKLDSLSIVEVNGIKIKRVQHYAKNKNSGLS